MKQGNFRRMGGSSQFWSL